MAVCGQARLPAQLPCATAAVLLDVPAMPVSLSHGVPDPQLGTGSLAAVSAATGKLTFTPTFAPGSFGSIARNHSEQVASSPVSGSGATIV